MTLFARHGSFLCLLGVACLMVSTEARAESREEAHKREFAKALARKAHHADKPESRKEIAAATRAAKRFSHVAAPAPSATGVPASSPLTPSGFGSGRDFFVEQAYLEILEREPVQSELDFWSGQLKKGSTQRGVATRIYDSLEHRYKVKTGFLPFIPFPQAFATIEGGS